MVNNTIENNDTANETGGETIVEEFRNRERPETYKMWWCNTCGTTFDLDKSRCPNCNSTDAFEQEFVKEGESA